MEDAVAHNNALYDNWERIAKAEKAELKRNTLRAIRLIFGKISTFNGTSTRKRRTAE